MIQPTLVGLLVVSCFLCVVLCSHDGAQVQQQTGTLTKLMLAQLSSPNPPMSDQKRQLLEQSATSNPNKKQMFEQDKLAKQARLKKKWHKLMDQLIDSEQLTKQPPQLMVNEPTARVRQPVVAKQQPTHQNDNQETVLLLERKPALITTNLLAPISSIDNPRQPQQRRPIDMTSHQNRILNDDFGILRRSVFTTNNHLGQKDVPKLGSDEQF